MVEKIINELRRSPHGARAIAKMAQYTIAETESKRVKEAQRHLAHHIQKYHGGRTDHFLYFMGTDQEVFVKAIEHYGRRQVGLD